MDLKLNETIYVREAVGGYQICIEMPDSSRNYLHCEVIKHIDLVSKYLKALDGISINEIGIITDAPYYRLYAAIPVDVDNQTVLHFHSRKLNLNDVFYEKELIESARK